MKEDAGLKYNYTKYKYPPLNSITSSSVNQEKWKLKTKQGNETKF